MQNGIKWNTQGNFNVTLNLRTTKKTLHLSTPVQWQLQILPHNGIGIKMTKNLQFSNLTIMEVKP